VIVENEHILCDASHEVDPPLVKHIRVGWNAHDREAT
jgi:hypothetical protein